MTFLVVHGHFYQPPRENPWTGEIEREKSAAPWHDWNERIHSECYRANGCSRVMNAFEQIARITNNYELINFNFGPTLMSWMERAHPAAYTRILEADRTSRARLGHGNAIAQGYNHSILPLLTARDRRTQLRWGKEDFRYRFGRAPEALWLPETGANAETLDDLIDEGMSYVILAPHQAGRIRASHGQWKTVASGELDTSVPYRYLHSDGSGRELAAFFYDGTPAQAIAFGAALGSSQAFIDHLKWAAKGPLVHAATDGETYGHHHSWGDRALTYALQDLAPSSGLEVTNYGRVLELLPARTIVELARGSDGRGTAWSCAHGLGRWMEDCGCQTGAKPGWNQAWRAPLRRALDRLNEHAGRFFGDDGRNSFEDPWQARDEYIHVLLDGSRTSPFLASHGRELENATRRSRALTHLEAQRSALLMFTSCGWFFNDVGGLETKQILKYAGRLVDLLERLGGPLAEEELLDELSLAKSNEVELGTAADLYRSVVNECRVRPTRVAAHAALTNLASPTLRTEGRVGANFVWRQTNIQARKIGRLSLTMGRLDVEELPLGRHDEASFAALHLGDADFYCAARLGPEDPEMRAALFDELHAASIPTLLRRAQAACGPEEFALEHVLPEGREVIARRVFGGIVERFVREYTYLYEDNARTIEVLETAGLALPEELEKAAEFALGHRLEAEILAQHERSDAPSYERALAIAEEIRAHGLKVTRPNLMKTFEGLLASAARKTADAPSAESVEATLRIAELIERLGVSVNRDHTQEIIYAARHHLRGVPGARELAAIIRLDPALVS
ncbi:MAG: DUF3536 domain-containing protein [Deltaproteobacteria bacterium]|nr:DUF3536 domain-containing protein [Deltaproteobacteria bacterium]